MKTDQQETGNLLEIPDRQPKLEILHGKIFGKKPPLPPPADDKQPPLSTDDEQPASLSIENLKKTAKDLSDIRLLKLLEGRWQEAKDREGKQYPSHSHADFALCSLLAELTDNATEVDRIFRQSGLCQTADRIKKWNRLGTKTIAKVLATKPEFAVQEKKKRPEVTQADPEAKPQPPKKLWPTLGEEAFYGVAGQFARLVEPHTESDPIGVLLQFLAGAGNLLGRNIEIEIDGAIHSTNIFLCLVGKTAKSRKGTSWNHPRRLLVAADPEWQDRVQGGLSSGEGLIWAVRDEIIKREKVKSTKGEPDRYEDVVVDPGVDDKRLIAFESEFASVLKLMGREGNILSTIMRQAWDSGIIRTMTKNSPAKATGAHITVVAHITADELKRHLGEGEIENGFANRFLWACVRRSKLLPFGGDLSKVDFQPILSKLAHARTWAAIPRKIIWDDPARRLWEEVYPTLTAARPGLAGTLLARSEPQAVRLAMIYASLACSPCIREAHLQAALAVVDYCEESVLYLFGEATGDYVADRILKALQNSPDGMTKKQIIDILFQRNIKAGRLDIALATLLEAGKARVETKETGGRPAEVWLAT